MERSKHRFLKRLIVGVACFVLLSTIFLGLWIGQLYAYYYFYNHSPEQQEIFHYLLMSNTSGFMSVHYLDIFEKRHLLDVKRLFSVFHFLLWAGLFISLLVLMWLKEQLATLYGTLLYSGLILVALFLTLLLTNFSLFFGLVHPLIFIENTWVFQENSILIVLFPIEYFYRFSLINICFLGGVIIAIAIALH